MLNVYIDPSGPLCLKDQGMVSLNVLGSLVDPHKILDCPCLPPSGVVSYKIHIVKYYVIGEHQTWKLTNKSLPKRIIEAPSSVWSL